MRNRMSSVCDQLIDFLTGIIDWLWDTVELVFDILLEFLVRGIELAIAILHLAFQVICFLRDLCIEAMQTFANVFRGVVNVVSSIKCEDVEDFATACIVVLLWIGAVKIALGIVHRKQWTFPKSMIGLLARPDCPHMPRDKLPNFIKDTLKTKITDARRRGNKQSKNSSVSSASSGSSYIGD